MIISHNLKLIFIHVHRTGRSTIINLLKNQLGNKVDIISQHGNAKTPESYLLEKHKDYYTFGFVRNPWERILSWYSLMHKYNQKNLAQERIRFEKFLDLDYSLDFTNQCFQYNQIDYFSDNKGAMKVNKIFRYENFENEIRELFNDLELRLEEIPIINNTWIKKYKEYYTQKSQDLIAQKCRKDIEHFNYIF